MALKETPNKNASRKNEPNPEISEQSISPHVRERTIKSRSAKKKASRSSESTLSRLVYDEPGGSNLAAASDNNSAPMVIGSLTPVISIVPNCCACFSHCHIHPATIHPWGPVIPATPMYVQHVPILHPPLIVEPYPYFGDLVTPSTSSPIVTEIHEGDTHDLAIDQTPHEYLDHTINSNTSIDDGDSEFFFNRNAENTVITTQPVEVYLDLPKDLFPPARILPFDPNPLIDEFCKLNDLDNHTDWILDLEFGIPKLPITRPIPIYSVKHNSINCKNTPEAIHPGFECCSQEFRRMFLFYYDCVISTWYRGFIITHNDASVENFQEWLFSPMQLLGMCWP